MFGRRYSDYDDIMYGRYGHAGGFEDFRAGFKCVSDRASTAESVAEDLFLKYLASADTSKGAVKEEIIQFHLVPDMKKKFFRFVKENGCSASSRKLSREEQDKFNKTRKSLMVFTSVTVSPEAQKAYLDKQRAMKSGPSAATTSNTVAAPLSPMHVNSLKRTADYAPEGEAGPSKPKKTKA
ncbi:hypothetical protein BT96DRAFT_916444 [Gymnopus androsaceus JB14]|uniref:Uncharacterized protein n=1 Tax=Gymnopus androsaceus JB14 TaxID=1447944 RepID=A0A6A4I7F1_9AGAR|nr:hypothetical protein BT96DRAFT_916444 [Gymnopus androsaceus JB14]